MHAAPFSDATADAAGAVPSVDGVPLAATDETLTAQQLRSRASVELLRQAAIRAGLLPASDPPPTAGVVSEAAADAIEALLDRELVRPAADEAACRRFHAANPARFGRGERARVRHVLFAITDGVDVDALRQRAEQCLLDLRAHRPGEADRFAAAAARLSNCPSGQDGGQLGWLGAQDCAPEFAREVFGHPEVGVLPRLVRSRFGFHVVEVLEREPGSVPPFEEVQDAVRQTLERHAYATALRQYVEILAGEARIEGVDLNAAHTPLVQ
jgi:peptidyl-prolyl cis-trans isomerase C